MGMQPGNSATWQAPLPDSPPDEGRAGVGGRSHYKYDSPRL